MDEYKININERGIGRADMMATCGIWPRPVGQRVIEVGFGRGELIQNLCKDNFVCGVDIGLKSMTGAREEGFEKDANLIYSDPCKERLPWPDDWFDIAYCTETIEHMSSPINAILEIKRVLKDSGMFLVSIPDHDDCFGYDGGQHAWSYPGLGQKKYFTMFMRQLWFGCVKTQEGGLYAFKNIKNEDSKKFNYLAVIFGNYKDKELYRGLYEDA